MATFSPAKVFGCLRNGLRSAVHSDAPDKLAMNGVQSAVENVPDEIRVVKMRMFRPKCPLAVYGPHRLVRPLDHPNVHQEHA